MTIEEAAVPETGVRARTRRAIIDAAISVWSHDFTAPLAEIADRADVSRSTLHRYFPERQTLIDAALAAAVTRLNCVGEEALVDGAPPRVQLEIMMRAAIDVGDAVIFLFSDPDRFLSDPQWSEGDDDQLPRLIRQAQDDGTLVADVDPGWVVAVFYSLIYVAAEGITSGQLPRHSAGDIAVRTFFSGVGAPPPAD